MTPPENAESITLWTTSAEPHELAEPTTDGLTQTLRAFLVVAIGSGDTPALQQTIRPGLEASRQWELELSAVLAKRFRHIFRCTQRGTAPPYECHSLTAFVYGAGNAIRLGRDSPDHRRSTLGEPVPDYALEAGRPYAVIRHRPFGADSPLALSNDAHSFISLGDRHPGFSVSIMEGQGPFIVSTNAETSRAFGGVEIRPLIYQAAGNLALSRINPE